MRIAILIAATIIGYAIDADAVKTFLVKDTPWATVLIIVSLGIMDASDSFRKK